MLLILLAITLLHNVVAIELKFSMKVPYYLLIT